MTNAALNSPVFFKPTVAFLKPRMAFFKPIIF